MKQYCIILFLLVSWPSLGSAQNGVTEDVPEEVEAGPVVAAELATVQEAEARLALVEAELATAQGSVAVFEAVEEAEATAENTIVCLGRWDSGPDCGPTEEPLHLRRQRGIASEIALVLGNTILIAFPDTNGGYKTLQEAGFTAVNILNEDEDSRTVGTYTAAAMSDSELGESYLIVVLNDALIETQPSHGSLIGIEVVTSRDADPETRYARWRNGFSLPGLGHSGFWIPVGLFASDLSRDAGTGIPFATMPVGLAWGVQFNLKNISLGVSAFASWMVRASTEESTDTGAGFTLQSLALGALINIGGWVAVGAGHAWDFGRADGVDDPGWFFTFGLGPRLINTIAGVAN